MAISHSMSCVCSHMCACHCMCTCPRVCACMCGMRMCSCACKETKYDPFHQVTMAVLNSSGSYGKFNLVNK